MKWMKYNEMQMKWKDIRLHGMNALNEIKSKDMRWHEHEHEIIWNAEDWMNEMKWNFTKSK